MQMTTCTRQTFHSKTFAKSFTIQKQYENNVWQKSNDAYQEHVLVVDKTTGHDEPYFDFYVFMFLRQYQRQRKCFLSERELKEALRDTVTRAACLGPVIFDWLVLSMCMEVIQDSSFARPGSAPIWGGKKGELRDWTNLNMASLPLIS